MSNKETRIRVDQGSKKVVIYDLIAAFPSGFTWNCNANDGWVVVPDHSLIMNLDQEKEKYAAQRVLEAMERIEKANRMGIDNASPWHTVRAEIAAIRSELAAGGSREGFGKEEHE